MEILELKEEIAEKEKDFIAKEKELNWLYETSMAEASGNIKVWHVRARRWAVILMFYWKSQCQTCFLRRRRRSWANRGRNFLTYRSSYFEPERAVNLTKSEEFFLEKVKFRCQDDDDDLMKVLCGRYIQTRRHICTHEITFSHLAMMRITIWPIVSTFGRRAFVQIREG